METTPSSTNKPSSSVGTQAALVTGASSGIGRATALRLAEQGWRVFAAARRTERLESLIEQAVQLPGDIIGVTVDVTDQGSVAALLERVESAGGVDTVLNIAGGALGTESIAEGRRDDWEWMFNTNVLGTLNILQAFLPMLRSCGEGTVLNLTSTAGIVSYEGGAGYNAAKFAQHAVTGTLRLEEAEHNVRVIEVLPGMVHTEEFTVNRLRGNAEAADQVYSGVRKPLTAEDVAEVCAHAVGLPHHINLDQIVMRPVKQAAQHKLIRDEEH